MLSVSHDQFKSDTGKGRLLYVGKHKHFKLRKNLCFRSHRIAFRLFLL